MFHNDSKLTARRAQRGSSLVIGIFVITVMFLLAGALLDIVEDSDEGLNQEVWGTRALAAANSGAEAAMAQLFPLDGSAGVCPVSSNWAPPNVVGFHACSVTLGCSSHTVGSQVQYRITSKAVCQSGDLRVSRQVEVEARGN